MVTQGSTLREPSNRKTSFVTSLTFHLFPPFRWLDVEEIPRYHTGYLKLGGATHLASEWLLWAHFL